MTRTVKRQMLIWGSVFLMVVGLTLHVRQMEFMACALALLGPLAYWLSRPLLRGLEVRRRAPSRMTAGDSTKVVLIVSNPGARPRPAFWVEDSIPEGLVADQPAQLVLDLGPGEERQVTYALRALRRGVYQLGPARLLGTDALGLHDFQEPVAEVTETVVYPRIVSLPDLWPQGPAERATPRRALRRPGGIDPRGSREYVPGDDLRHIHWKASAHRGKLTVVEREQSEGLRATAVLDLSAGVHAGRGNDTTLEYGVTVAASILAQALSCGATVGMIALGDRDYSVPADSSPGQQRRLLEALARCQEGEARSLTETLGVRLAALPRGSAVAIITPQSGPEVTGVAHLLASRGLRGLWFLLVAPSFELGVESTRAAEDHYRALAASLGRRGQPAYVVRAGDSLEAAFGRWLRAAS
jgi:uncharacterized protein (DUF58 family)